MLLQNLFIGTDGGAITSGNSGGASGDAFNTVFLSGTGAVEYDDDASSPVGTFCADCYTTAAGSANAYCQWTYSALTEAWFCWYFKTDDTSPATAPDILRLNSGAGATNAFNTRISAAGKILLRDAGSTTRYTSSLTLSANTWYRLEVHVAHSATVGHMEARIFVGANLHGTIADETMGSPSTNWDTGPSHVNVRAGICSTPGQAIHYWMAALRVSDVGWIGPYAQALLKIAPEAVEQAETLQKHRAVARLSAEAVEQAETLQRHRGLRRIFGEDVEKAETLQKVPGMVRQRNESLEIGQQLPGYAEFGGTTGERFQAPGGAWITDIDGDLDLRINANIAHPGATYPYLIASSNGGDYRWNMFAGDEGIGIDWNEAPGGAYMWYQSPQGLLNPGTARWYRVTLDVDNGAGGHTVNFYYSDDPPSTPTASVSWTLFSTDGAAGTTDVEPGLHAMWLGNYGGGGGILTGIIYVAEIWSKGVLVANPDFRSLVQYDSPTQLTDDFGNVWTPNSPAAWVLPIDNGPESLKFMNLTRLQAEAAEIAEDLQRHLDRIRLQGESVETAEAAQIHLARVRLINEAVELAEVVQLYIGLVRQSLEDVQIGETFQTYLERVRLINEAEQVAESLQDHLARVRMIAEDEEIAEASQTRLDLLRFQPESEEVMESMQTHLSRLRLIAETEEMAEALSRHVGMVRQEGDSVEIAEQLSELMGKIQVREESTEIIEVNMSVMGKVQSVAEALNMTEDGTTTLDRVRQLDEVVEVATALQDHLDRVRLLSEAVETVETIIRGVGIVSLTSNSVEVSDATLKHLGLSRQISEDEEVPEQVIFPTSVLKVKGEAIESAEGNSSFLGKVQVFTENLEIAEIMAKVLGKVEVFGEALQIADVVSVLEARVRMLAETVQAVDSIDHLSARVRILTESVDLPDQSIVAMGLVRVRNQQVEVIDQRIRVMSITRETDEYLNLAETSLHLSGLTIVFSDVLEILEDELSLVGVIFVGDTRMTFKAKVNDQRYSSKVIKRPKGKGKVRE